MGIFQNHLMGAAAAAASAGATGFYSYQIANSIRGSAAADTTLKFTAGTPTSTTKMTMSFWVKRYTPNSTDAGANNVFTTGTGGGNYFYIAYNATLTMENTGGNQGTGYLLTEEKYRDSSAWYHVILRIDTSQSTQFDRIRVYVNGHQLGVDEAWRNQAMITNTAQDETFSYLNADGLVQAWGGLSGKGHGTEGADLQLADCMFFDGQSYYSELGEYKNGVWIPKDPSGLTFGNNGYWLKFESSSDLGNDSSGNNNDFTVANFAAHDQMLDTPTFDSSSNGGNFATLGPLWKTPDMTFSEGNLKWTTSTNQRGAMSNWSIPLEGKYYFEYVPLSWGHSSGDDMWLGLNVSTVDFTASRGGKATCYGYGANSGKKIDGDGTEDSYGASWGTDDIIGVAVDRVNDTIQFSKNGSFQGSAFAIPATADLFPWVGSGGGTSSASGVFNFGQDGTFAGNVTAGGNSDDTGYGNFKYDPPTGFLALCSGNLLVADVVDPAQTDDDFPQKLFDAKLYTGSGGTQTISGVGFQPDFTWIKNRGATADHVLMDSTRGAYASNDYYYQRSNTTALQDHTTDFHNFASDGFIVGGTGTYFNASGNTFASWNWRANGGTTSTNTQGSEDSTVQADPSGGFSIVKWTGTSDSWSNAITVGHGLSAAPNVMLCKKYLGNTDQWEVFFSDYGSYSIGGSNAASNSLRLDTDAALYTNQSYKSFGGVMPTSTVFTVDGNNLNGSGDTIIAYCFANCEGYIKAGTYVGNGDGSDGAFVYTGFRPAWVLTKRLTTNSWRIQDNAMDTYNPAYHVLKPQSSAAQDAYTDGTDYNDFLSNGFKVARGGDTANFNANGETYVYLAMAHNPFKYATAR